MTDCDSIRETRQGNIKIVQFNKPKRKNAIDAEMYVKVTNILKEATNDVDISVMVLTGAGDYYSSGNDLVAAMEQVSAGENKLASILKEYINAFIMFPKLLVAVVNGPAIGIAATTLGLCDLVFASEKSFFYTPFTKLGLVAEGCSTYTFPRLMGDRKAADMLLYNYTMTAREAVRCGFVNYMYKPHEIQNKVWDKIAEVSKLPQQSILASKRLLRRKNRQEMIQANEAEMKELDNVWSSEEYFNSVLNFVNKKSKM